MDDTEVCERLEMLELVTEEIERRLDEVLSALQDE